MKRCSADQKFPKISIVTASYNQARFIDKAIESVMLQDYPDFEHIIFDNCSTDGTIDILKKYPHLIWISEPDKGQTDALNKGLRKATGELIGWLNTDDVYLPGCFHSVIRAFKENSNPAVVYGDYRWVDQEGDLIKLRREIDFDLFILKYLHVPIYTTTAFLRYDVLKENDFLNGDYEYGMDYEFFLRIALKSHRFVHLKTFLADFRWHSGSKTTLYADRQIADKEKALFLHDTVMQRMYRPVRPAARFLLMVMARAKRTLLKIIDSSKAQ